MSSVRESSTVPPATLNFLEKRNPPTLENMTPILFIHGSESSKETWLPVINKLDNRYHIVAIDLPGHGESPLEDEDLSLKKVIATIHQFIAQKELSPFVLVAHSMGARVAVTYAAKYPHMIKGLVLEDMEMIPREREEVDDKKMGWLKKFKPQHSNLESLREELKKYGYEERRTSTWLAKGGIKYFPKKEIYRSGVDPYVTVLSRNGISANATALESFARLKEHPFPVLLLKAEDESSVTEEGVRQMQELHPRLTVEEIEDSKHSIHKTATAIFTQILTTFIEKIMIKV